MLRNPDFHADTKWSHIKSQNDLNAACYFLTIQFSVLIDHILVQEKEIASSLRQPANHTSDNQLIGLSKIPKKFKALVFTYGQYVVIELADKLYNSATVWHKSQAGTQHGLGALQRSNRLAIWMKVVFELAKHKLKTRLNNDMY